MSGCIYDHFWVYAVSEGGVTLVDEYGDSLPILPTTWGRVKAIFQE